MAQESKPVILGKSLAEVKHLVDAGEILHAHTGKLGDTRLYRDTYAHRYIYELDYCRSGIAYKSDPGEDLDALLQYVLSDTIEDELSDIAQEMKEMLSLPVWSNIDEESYNYQLWELEQAQGKIKKEHVCDVFCNHDCANRKAFNSLLGDIEIDL